MAAPRRVLVVDDEPDLRRFFVRQLERAGIEAAACAAAEEAFAALVQGGFDAVLVDVYFGPAPDGLELLSRLRAEPATAALPVVIMSGSGERALKTASAAGADAVLAKPFGAPDLLAALDRAVVLRAAAAGGEQGGSEGLDPVEETG